MLINIKLKNVICFIAILGILTGCKKEELPNPPFDIEVYTQEDMDLVCSLISEEGVFEGSLKLWSEDLLEYSCLQNLKLVTGFLGVSASNSTRFLTRLESVTGEGFMFCDPTADTISFPSLVEVSGGFTSPFNCSNYKVIYVPNLKSAASVTLGAVGESNGPSQLRYVSGMDDLTDCRFVQIFSRQDSLIIDGFRSLNSVWDFFSVKNFKGHLKMTPASFSNLQHVHRANVGAWGGSTIDFTFSFSSVDSCEYFGCMGDFEIEELCLFVPRIKSGAIKGFSTSNLTQTEIIDACE